MSETSLIRGIAIKHCIGKGVDLGCGSDKISDDVWGFELPNPYGAGIGDYKVELRGDARNLPFNDNVLDYVFSSHLLEDFPNTELVLREWIRVLKKGGKLILYLPNEMIYRDYCRVTGQDYNHSHTIEEMSLPYILDILKDIGITKVIESIEHHADYSFYIVVEKL